MESKRRKRAENTNDMILTFIIHYFAEHGYAPSIREICAGTGIGSTCTVHTHMKCLYEEGLLETDAEEYSPRAYRVTGARFVFGE